MKWNEFLNRETPNEFIGQKLTNIECPECGRKIYYDSTKVLTSYPQKYQYWCTCGWVGYAQIRWI